MYLTVCNLYVVCKGCVSCNLLHLKIVSSVRYTKWVLYLKCVVLFVVRTETLPRHTSTLVISSKHRSSYRSVAFSVCSCDIYSSCRPVT